MLDERKLQVLRAIVTDYVSSREPVGSKALVDRYDLGVSPATVRNDMAALEDEGYIAQPHTSAGRIPTDKGYRLFVDRLAGLKPLSAAERRAIQTFLSGAADVDEIVARTVRLLAQITQQVAIVQYPVLTATTLRHVEVVSLTPDRVLLIVINSAGRVEQRTVELPGHTEEQLSVLKTRLNEAVLGRAQADAANELSRLSSAVGPEDQATTQVAIAAVLEILGSGTATRVMVGGVPNLTRLGDFNSTVQPVLEALEEQVVLLKLLDESVSADDVTVRIGRENDYAPLQTTSLVASAYGSHDDVWASMGIVGPTRMDYPSTMATVRAVARYVGRFLSEG
ncbi:heat-inducible transcriptional repressor HrcA [Enemella evansiae]|uniref:heat-inducible transcriptional repressor HrcA n=1 Tax=Enemella evansiae TaxID=2016499 RepID=UPI000B97C036|nr:heat-inducible transcriptional repressor HrcA [Enemella evansiae]OYO06634.1 heat-inducible transcriptional repressor HrcA [Enemella evansiae]